MLGVCLQESDVQRLSPQGPVCRWQLVGLSGPTIILDLGVRVGFSVVSVIGDVLSTYGGDVGYGEHFEKVAACLEDVQLFGCKTMCNEAFHNK